MMLRYVAIPDDTMFAAWPNDCSHRVFAPRSERQAKPFGNASACQCEVLTPNLSEKQEPHSHNVVLVLDNIVLP
jgi:hypothetical protein